MLKGESTGQLPSDSVLEYRRGGETRGSHMSSQPPGPTMIDGLSKRECDVLSCLQKGLSNKEIGMVLGISPRTVQKHLQRVYRCLGVESRVEAVVMTQHVAVIAF